MALTGLLCLSGVAGAHAEVPHGVAVTPRNFPDHAMVDVDHAFRLAREVGRHAVFIYQWGELDRDPVLIMEAGWPTSGSGNEAEQVAFLERLPRLLKGINLVGLEWALLHDVQIGAFDANLNTVGLRYRDGRPKPGYDRFRVLQLR
jgi:hypothetical protein